MRDTSQSSNIYRYIKLPRQTVTNLVKTHIFHITFRPYSNNEYDISKQNLGQMRISDSSYSSCQVFTAALLVCFKYFLPSPSTGFRWESVISISSALILLLTLQHSLIVTRVTASEFRRCTSCQSSLVIRSGTGSMQLLSDTFFYSLMNGLIVNNLNVPSFVSSLSLMRS